VTRISPLLRKELRSLAPFLGLVLFLIAMNWGYTFLMKFPDQHTLSKLLEHDTDDQVMLFVLAFALAAGLLVRERDEGTLAFLDALPVSRARIFACKVVPAIGVLWLIPLSDLVLKLLLHALSRTSIETHSPNTLFLTGSLLDAASCVIYFFLALMLSFLRRFSYLVLALMICAYLFLQELEAPFVPLFNLLTLSDPIYQGRHWLVPTAKLLTQLLIAAICGGSAFGLFLMMGDASQRLAQRTKHRRGAVVLASMCTALAVAVWIGLAVFWIGRSKPDRSSQVVYQSWPIARANTSRYQFVYRENQAAFVNQFLQSADAVEGRVREFLGAESINRIEADLTGSAPHTAGVAHWKTVQIDLTAVGRDAESLMAVLAHETTHVYIDHESRSHLNDDFNSTRFFHEGLASFVEYHLFRPANQLAFIRRVAATMRARRQVKFAKLLDDSALMQELDTDLVYPLGEVFVAALVGRYGDSAPAKVVKAFNRPNAPKALKGFALWQDVFQACGYSLSAVEDGFYQVLDEAVADQRSFIDSLPRLRGTIQVDARKILLRANHEGRAPGIVVCRFRPRSDTPARLYEYAFPGQGNVFPVNTSGYSDRSFWYQIGWQTPGASQPIWEPWVETIKER
jgi:ABC-type transport system involved in multi-copper enzyme maturation permease subunit